MPDQQAIFKGRTPEAAASQTARVLAWLTECQLATLEGIEGKKSTPAYILHRQASICNDAVVQCHELGVEPYGLNGRFCQRLADRLSEINKRNQT